MSDPKPAIAAREPVQVDLKQGESYWWCRCGLSKSQPFCDGSHEGGPFEPLEYVPPKDQTVFLCACKRTKRPPFCDGTHNKLPD